jgi:Glycosyltransferase sugar-binding region containing DXD motif/Alpha 1,4-glycosyltransferase conserved region
MRLAIITTYEAQASEEIESLWHATALAALAAGHQVLVSHGPACTPARLASLSVQGAQLHLRPPQSRTWAVRRRKPTLAALANFAPHAVLVAQSRSYEVAAPDRAELREALLEERLSFLLSCPTQEPSAPTAKMLRDARSIFSAATICAFDSPASTERARSQLNVALADARIAPADPARVLEWLESIAGRRGAADARPCGTTTAALPTTAVEMFWHGPALSRLERLCMASFMAHGHTVRLHTYEEPRGVPAGVQIQDASRILAERYLFRHTKSGSVAAFADWFRYVLLHEHGGIWVDTDVVCLKPLHYSQPLLFGRQDEQIINNAVLGLPARHELAAWMIDCCEFPNRVRPYDKQRTRRRKLKRRLFQGNQRGNIAWGENGPLGFTQAARHLGYDHHALPFWHFYPVHFSNWRSVFDSGLKENPHLIGGSHALHLWNEMVRRAPGFHPERRFDPNSLFEQLCARYLTSDS